MTDTALVALALSAIAGLLAGRAWGSALRRGGAHERPTFRTSPHYTEGLHSLAAGQLELAISELNKVAEQDKDAVEVLLVLGNLLREAGRVERAIAVHQRLLQRPDLTRAERVHVQACLGSDYRRAGFLDRAGATFEAALEADPGNIHALMGLQKLHEEQRAWTEAYDIRVRLSRLRKTDDRLVLGHLRAEMAREVAARGRRDEAFEEFRAALTLDNRVYPAYLGLADLEMDARPQVAAEILEEAIRVAPERAYLAFSRLQKAYTSLGQPERFIDLCERIIRQDPRDWRARLALAQKLRADGKPEEAYGLLLRAIEANPQVLLAHLEMWRTLEAMGVGGEAVEGYVATAEEAVFFAAPHICTSCRYRADEMLWRCPHCHNWNTFVEERVGPTAGT